MSEYGVSGPTDAENFSIADFARSLIGQHEAGGRKPSPNPVLVFDALVSRGVDPCDLWKGALEHVAEMEEPNKGPAVSRVRDFFAGQDAKMMGIAGAKMPSRRGGQTR